VAFSGDVDVVDAVLHDSSGSQVAVRLNQTVDELQPVILVGGLSGSMVLAPRLDRDGSSFTKITEEPTFIVNATGIQIGNQKSMISIHNASSNKVIKIREIYMCNVQTTSTTGIVGIFEMRRIGGHSGGTQINTFETMDTTDLLEPGVTFRTGATVSNESTSLIRRALWSTDEWGAGTLDQEGNEHGFQNMFAIYARRDMSLKPLVLRSGQGMHIEHVVNSVNGSFDLIIIFTQA
jgi:hypothetical protein